MLACATLFADRSGIVTDCQGMGEADGDLLMHIREVERRLRIMREWINHADWDGLCRADGSAKRWFDEDGNVV